MRPAAGDERPDRGPRGPSHPDLDEPADPGASTSGWDFAREAGEDERDRPWWASGNGAEQGHTGGSRRDPFGRERRAGGASAHAHERHAHGPAGEPHARAPHDTCQVCPVCSLLRTLDEVRPEVVEHLSEAARHVTLAAKAFIDAQAAGYGAHGEDTDFERIDLDD